MSLVTDSVDRALRAVTRAADQLRVAIAGSALAALMAWFALFGIRSGDGGPWVVAGGLVLAILLVPAVALWYLRRRFLFVASLPERMTDYFASLLDTSDPDRVRRRLDDLSGKRGLRLVLAIGSFVRWVQRDLDLPTLASTTQETGRLAATIPIATAIGVVGTVAVVLLIPLFIVASAALVLLS